MARTNLNSPLIKEFYESRTLNLQIMAKTAKGSKSIPKWMLPNSGQPRGGMQSGKEVNAVNQRFVDLHVGWAWTQENLIRQLPEVPLLYQMEQKRQSVLVLCTQRKRLMQKQLEPSL